MKFVLGRVENIVRKGENAGYQHFLLFPQYFQKLSFLGLCGKGLNSKQSVHYREDLIAYYGKLSAEAAQREQKALWRVRRAKLEIARNEFFIQQERKLAADMDRAKSDPVCDSCLVFMS